MSLSVLVVDDSVTMRRIITGALKRIGYGDIVEAGDGAEAYEKLENHGEIGIIVTDWNMPGMSGLDFVTKVRAGEFKAVPILMVTTRNIREDLIEALKAGVNGFIVKPFAPGTLQEKINRILAGN